MDPVFQLILSVVRFGGKSVSESDETVNAFITALCRLVETCNYSQLTNEMISDQIVVWIYDNAVAERLQLNSQLRLESFQVTRLNQVLKA